MNRRMVFYMVGQMVKIEALLLILPLITSIIYQEKCMWSILVTAIIALVVGFSCTRFFKPKNKVIYAKEGFVIVALAWLALSAIGALPFVISGEIPSYVDAFFETVSGFTTTGASILTDIEAMSKGLLFWRSFTHWIGGMGILVFVIAIIPNTASSDRTIHILRAEVPGPIVGKLVPRIKQTATILYLIYIAITLLEIVLLLISKMPLFDSIIHSFGTAGTGGFGIKADSITSYTPVQQWIITVFMLLFGINFNIYYLLLVKRFRSVLKSGELWCYISIVAVAVFLVCSNTYSLYENLSEALRHSAFQVSSIITTTGFSSVDFNNWPVFSKSIILILMIIGACAGSTGGGIKVSRIIMLFKSVKNEFARLLHPRSVNVIKLEGKRLDNSTLSSTSAYFVIYSVCAVAIFLIISALNAQFDIETNLSATISCFNNIGPGLGAVGPMFNYADYSALSKIVLSLAMLLGRLEIYPIIITLTLSTWKKKK